MHIGIDTLAQLLSLAFAAGILWTKLKGIERQLLRINGQWAESDRRIMELEKQQIKQNTICSDICSRLMKKLDKEEIK